MDGGEVRGGLRGLSFREVRVIPRLSQSAIHDDETSMSIKLEVLMKYLGITYEKFSVEKII